MLRQTALLFMLLTAAVPCTLAQDEPQPVEAPLQVVTGTVADFSSTRLMVTRTVLGKPPETLTFTISGDTVIEGRLRLRARVTVGYKSAEETEPVAVRIIVRPQNQK